MRPCIFVEETHVTGISLRFCLMVARRRDNAEQYLLALMVAPWGMESSRYGHRRSPKTINITYPNASHKWRLNHQQAPAISLSESRPSSIQSGHRCYWFPRLRSVEQVPGRTTIPVQWWSPESSPIVVPQSAGRVLPNGHLKFRTAMGEMPELVWGLCIKKGKVHRIVRMFVITCMYLILVSKMYGQRHSGSPSYVGKRDRFP